MSIPYMPEMNRPGPIDPRDYNRLIADVRHASEVEGDGVDGGAIGMAFRTPPDNTPFEALITANVGNQHSWYRLTSLSGGPQNDVQNPNGEAGISSLGTSSLPAYAIDGSTVAAGTKVLMWYADTGTEMRFVAMASVPQPVYGSITSLATYTITLAGGTSSPHFQYTGFSINLPVAGTYLVSCNVEALLDCGNGIVTAATSILACLSLTSGALDGTGPAQDGCVAAAFCGFADQANQFGPVAVSGTAVVRRRFTVAAPATIFLNTFLNNNAANRAFIGAALGGTVTMDYLKIA